MAQKYHTIEVVKRGHLSLAFFALISVSAAEMPRYRFAEYVFPFAGSEIGSQVSGGNLNHHSIGDVIGKPGAYSKVTAPQRTIYSAWAVNERLTQVSYRGTNGADFDGYILDGQFNKASTKLPGNKSFDFAGGTADGTLMGAVSYDTTTQAGVLYNPITGYYQELNALRLNWVVSGNSKGQYAVAVSDDISQQPFFRTYRDASGGFVFDSKTGQVTGGFEGMTPHLMAEDGTVYGAYSTSPFTWKPGLGIQKIPFLGESGGLNTQMTEMYNVNSSGTVTGRFDWNKWDPETKSRGWDAFLVVNGKGVRFKDLQVDNMPSQYKVFQPWVFDNGEIFAWCLDKSDGQDLSKSRLIRLTPVPEPGTLVALALGTLGVLRRKKLAAERRKQD